MKGAKKGFWKRLGIVIAIVLSVLFLLTQPILFSYFVLAAEEDYTTWEEVDGGNDITVIDDTITWVNLPRSVESYVYKDYGVDYFDGNFQHNFTFQIDSSVAGSAVAVWVLANDIDDFSGLKTNEKSHLRIFTDNPSIPDEVRLYIGEINGTDYYQSSSKVITEATPYYVTVSRNEAVGTYGTIYCKFYTNDTRTNLVDTISLTLHESKKDFRYLYSLSASNSGYSYKTSGVVSNLTLAIAGEPTCTTEAAEGIAYDAYLDKFSATLNGTVTDDGGESCTGAFYWRIKGTSEFSGSGVSGTYETGESFNDFIYNWFLPETTYEYKARATNSVGYHEGALVEFTTSYYTGIPVVSTNVGSIDMDADALTAEIYGQIESDGSSNCTGWFNYREAGEDTWLVSDNTTDLQSTDIFHELVEDIVLGTEYDYRAVASNDSGNATGAIGTFTVWDYYAPEVSTEGYTLLTATSVWLRAKLIDNGNDEDDEQGCAVWFEYRKSGDVNWVTTSQFPAVTENTTVSRDITGLSASQNYEYRAVASNLDYTGYGEIMTFFTYDLTTIPIMSTDNVTYVSAGTVSVTGTVRYDGGSFTNMWFQHRIYGGTIWTDIDYNTPNMSTGESDFWYISGLENGIEYQARSVGQNDVGLGYGNIITFIMSEDVDVGPDIPAEGGIATFIKNLRESLGLTGVMGTWAFMGLVIVLLSLVFGIAMAAVNGVARLAVGVAWLLASISVVGGFIFTGELGIWPIVILVGGLVGFVMIIVGRTLSGGGSDG